METHKPETKSATLPAPKQPDGKKRRFKVVKLEERIAPSGGDTSYTYSIATAFKCARQ
jgi:hypothetical protein